MPICKFPEKFKWGSATSAHQIEGNNHNDWTEWETSRKRSEELKNKDKDPAVFISGKACDSYNRYQEDFDIVKKLNQNIYRFSIEWSRIEPEEGRFDEKEMQHYVNIVKSLRERGIEPMITLWHFTNPVWFAKKGSFINLNSPDYFNRYIKYVVKHLAEVQLWITFNEATTIYSVLGYLNDRWPPGYRSFLKWRRVNKNILKSHIKAYKTIKEICQHSPNSLDINIAGHTSLTAHEDQKGDVSHNVEVGIVENVSYVISGKSIYQRLAGKIYDYYRNFEIWNKAFPYYDFIGLNYYHLDRTISGSYKILPKQEIIPEMEWEIYPEGLYHLLLRFKDFKKPIFVTENGCADRTDKIRAKYIKDHLYWLWRAIQDGVNVKGYLYWSLLDNFEWDKGFDPRFGLVEVDYKTLERHIRPSAYEYAKICEENALNY